MRVVLFFFFFISFIQINSAQVTNESSGNVELNSRSETLASKKILANKPKKDNKSKGGFYDYIYANYRMPSVSGLEGKIVVDFVINEDGSIGDFKIVEDLGYGTAEELIRVLKTTQGKWTPGMQDGKPVKTNYSLPLTISTE